MAGDAWIIGASMTKFGRYPDKDSIDLASEAALAAMDDAGATIHDIQILAAGSLMEASNMLGQRLQKQIGQTGIPVYNVANACATGATAVRTGIMAIKAGEADMALAVGVEQMGKMGLLGSAGQARSAPKGFEPSGRYGSVMPVEGILGTQLMPGVFAQAGMDYASRHDGVGFEQFAKVAEKNHAHSSLNPLAQYRKVFSLEEVMEAAMVAYPNTLLMCCPTGDGAASVVLCSDAKLKTLDPDVRRRAVKISASVLTSDPYVESDTAQPDVSTLTKRAAAAAYEEAGVSPRTSTSSSSTTASPRPSSSTTRTSSSVSPAAPVTSSTGAVHGVTGPSPSTCRAASSPRATPSAPPVSPTSTRWPPICAGRRATARSRGPGWG